MRAIAVDGRRNGNDLVAVCIYRTARAETSVEVSTLVVVRVLNMHVLPGGVELDLPCRRHASPDSQQARE